MSYGTYGHTVLSLDIPLYRSFKTHFMHNLESQSINIVFTSQILSFNTVLQLCLCSHSISQLPHSIKHLLFHCRCYCALSRKVAGSIPDYVIWDFHWHNPSGHTMTLGSTQPLTEMSTMDIFWWIKTAGT